MAEAAQAAAAAVLVTRPAREARRWVDALRAQGIAACALPLVDIGPAPDPEALARCRRELACHAAVMFVSANAVEGLLPPGQAWPAGPRAWATGPGTRAALEAAGVPPSCIDAPPPDAAQFDSEALWSRVAGQVSPGDRVLVVRGADAQGRPGGRDWLERQLAAAGATARTVAAYRRQLPAWSAVQRSQADAARAANAWWLFSSSESIANLGRLLPGQDWSGARALCTHPRIARAAREAGFGQVAEVRPVLQAVAAFLQSRT